MRYLQSERIAAITRSVHAAGAASAPTSTPTASLIDPKHAHQSQLDNLKAAMWRQESVSAPSFSLFHAYELQRDVYLTMMELELYDHLDEEKFDLTWSRSRKYENSQNLLCEMIAREDLVLDCPEKLMVPIGHIGARIVLYYLHLEEELHDKRQLDKAVEEERQPRLPDCTKPLIAQASQSTVEAYDQWRQILVKLRDEFSDKELVKDWLSKIHERELVAQRGELSIGHYLYGMTRSYVQLLNSLNALAAGRVDVTKHDLQVQLTLPPPSWQPPLWLSTRPPISGSVLKKRYLGHYESLFDDPTEIPIPSWKAIEWLLEDYGQSRTEVRSWDLVYKQLLNDQELVNWTVQPPVAVATNAHYCSLEPRRFKWDPEATIDSVEYNWPIIPGQFDSAEACAEAYGSYFARHKTHTDPVCFRAAVFCNFLYEMCHTYKW